jgi:hypothetical protein
MQPLSIPLGVIGAPVALATIPMIISYTLFPLASGAGYLMPEATEGLSNALARGSLYEIGASTRYASPNPIYLQLGRHLLIDSVLLKLIVVFS